MLVEAGYHRHRHLVVEELTQADDIYWCNGSKSEHQSLIEKMKESGDFIELNQETHPGCYLHRSDPSDVARVEHLTFVCTPEKEDAGPNNNWMEPGEARALMKSNFSACMKGRIRSCCILFGLAVVRASLMSTCTFSLVLN